MYNASQLIFGTVYTLVYTVERNTNKIWSSFEFGNDVDGKKFDNAPHFSEQSTYQNVMAIHIWNGYITLVNKAFHIQIQPILKREVSQERTFFFMVRSAYLGTEKSTITVGLKQKG